MGEQAAADVQANTDGTIDSMAQYWNEKIAPQYYQEYLKTGDIQKAHAFKKYAENENVQQGMKYGAQALRSPILLILHPVNRVLLLPMAWVL